MNRKFFVLAFAAASMAIHMPAQATASASASLTDITITLVDLDPNDGVTPWILFHGRTFIGAGARDSRQGEPTPSSEPSSGPFDVWTRTDSASQSIANAGAVGIGTASNIISGAGKSVIGSLFADGRVNGTDGRLGYDSSDFTGSATWNGNNSGFYLSANTQLLVSATAAVSAAVTHGRTAWRGPVEFAQAWAHLDLWTSGGRANPDLWRAEVKVDNASIGPDGQPVYPFADSLNVVLEGSLLNSTNSSLFGGFTAYVLAQGISYATAVPEPTTTAMLLVGFVALSLVAARGRRE